MATNKCSWPYWHKLTLGCTEHEWPFWEVLVDSITKIWLIKFSREQKYVIRKNKIDVEHFFAKSRMFKSNVAISSQLNIIYMKISEGERSYCELLEWEKAEDRTGDGRMRVGGMDVNSRGQGEEFCHPSSRNRKWVKTSLLTFWPLQITFPPSPIPAAVWSPPSLPGSFSPTCFLYASPTPWISTARSLVSLNWSSETTLPKWFTDWLISEQYGLKTCDSHCRS